MENNTRVKKNVNNTINKFELDLTGITVFTEAATGNYVFTPIIAALAGAEKVYAITRDSKYGKKEEAKERTLKTAKSLGVEDKIHVMFDKKLEYIGECDIITNSGFVRPIDKEMIDSMKATAVISLMFEPWEFREEDLDLDYCRKRGIVVLGTNENHDKLKLFYSIGFFITKLLFECGFEVYKNKFLIIGSGKIGRYIQDFFNNNFIENKRITFDERESSKDVLFYKGFNGDIKWLNDVDGVILCERIYKKPLLSNSGLINEQNIDLFSDKMFIHMCGEVDLEFISENKINIYPKDIAKSGHLTRSADYLGSLFTIELNTAGLKVGEIMARLRKEGKAYKETIEIAKNNTIVMAFPGGDIYD